MILLQRDDEALTKLLAGGVGVMPTDTVYGLVARADNRGAVARLYALKRREHKPGTIIAASVQQLIELGVEEHYLRRVEHVWPAAISVIIPCGSELAYLHLDLFGVAVRIPKDNALHALLEETGPLLTTSANAPGEPTANNLQEARDYFGDHADFYVDGGDLSRCTSSTVVRLSGNSLEVLREGGVKIAPE